MALASSPTGQNAWAISTGVGQGLGTTLQEGRPLAAATATASGKDTATAASSMLVAAACTPMSASADALVMAMVSSPSSQNSQAI